VHRTRNKEGSASPESTLLQGGEIETKQGTLRELLSIDEQASFRLEHLKGLRPAGRWKGTVKQGKILFGEVHVEGGTVLTHMG
jgi:hypothetical protein